MNFKYTLGIIYDLKMLNLSFLFSRVTPKDLEGGLISLKYVKFQNVMNMTVFIKDNQSGAETTRINHFQMIGSPVATTNMSDFKRVAGKKGESH